MSTRLRIWTTLTARHNPRRLVATAALLSSLVITSSAAPAGVGNAVLDWNQIALTATTSTTPPQGPQPQGRTMAIVHTAIHDAVNGITGEYDTYLSTAAPPANASPDAAAIGAAHYVLTRLFPLQVATFDAGKTATLAAYGLTALDPGIGVGESAGAAILSLRSTDGFAQAQFPYTAPGAGSPGVWVAVGTAAPLLPGLGRVTPWVLHSGSQFRPDAPPALEGRRYARDYNEVKAVGSLTSVTRTAEQTNIARFWLGTPSVIWNNPARQVLEARGSNLSDTARAFALMYIAAADATIACWDAKYIYNYWRPTTAIPNAATDGNDDTVPDTGWQPFLGTPQHPEYPSGHTTNSGAMAGVLELLFGDNPGVPLVATSPTNPGFVRNWTAFSEGVEEVIDGRIYAGYHFRTADEVGAKLGGQVAHFVLTHALKEAKGKK